MDRPGRSPARRGLNYAPQKTKSPELNRWPSGTPSRRFPTPHRHRAALLPPMASAPSTTASTLAPTLPLRSPFPSSSRLPTRRLFPPRTASSSSSALLCRTPAPALARARVRCRAAVKLVGDGEFEAEVLHSELPVLVDFVADWCGPCRLVAPVVDWASEEYEGRLKIVKIDHDANPQIIEKYKVYGLPALILFKNGQEVPGSRREGAINKAKFKDYIEPLLETSNVA